jgi:hypothetical protein
MPGSKPAPDEIGNHTNGEPVIEQSRPGAALLACSGKQFEGTTLVRVELAFFMQSAHRIALRRDPASNATDDPGFLDCPGPDRNFATSRLDRPDVRFLRQTRR